MVNLTKLVSIGPQLTPLGICELEAQGVRHIICNRPDNEEENQINFTDIAEATACTNLTVTYVPVYSSDGPHPQAIAETAEILDLNERTHMYCRSGMRSVLLWAAVEARNGKPLDTIISTAERAGYNIEFFYDFLRNRRF